MRIGVGLLVGCLIACDDGPLLQAGAGNGGQPDAGVPSGENAGNASGGNHTGGSQSGQQSGGGSNGGQQNGANQGGTGQGGANQNGGSGGNPNGGSTAAAGSGANGEGVPQDQFAALMAAAICDNVGHCCNVLTVSHDDATCRAEALARLEPAMTERFSGAYQLDYDPERAARCIAGLEHAASTCTRFECEFTVGEVPEGDACQSDLECAGDPVTDDISCTDGVCTVVHKSPRRGVGDDCSFSCSARQDATQCQPSLPGRDGELVEAGGCYEEDGLYCNTIALQCEAIPTTGSSCGSSAFGNFCGDDSYCTEDRLCAASTGTLGQDCTQLTDNDSCVEGTCQDGRCQPNIDSHWCSGTL